MPRRYAGPRTTTCCRPASGPPPPDTVVSRTRQPDSTIRWNEGSTTDETTGSRDAPGTVRPSTGEGENVRLMRPLLSRRPHSRQVLRVDDEGVHFDRSFSGSLDVVM